MTNPSLKPSPNGGPRGPQAGVVHLKDDDLVSTASASTINGVFAFAGRMLVPTTLRLSTITQYRLAKEIDVPAKPISEIVAGRRAIAADTGLRLCRFSGLSGGYWLRAQVARDTEVAERELAPVLRKIRPWPATTTQQGSAADAAARRR